VRNVFDIGNSSNVGISKFMKKLLLSSKAFESLLLDDVVPIEDVDVELEPTNILSKDIGLT
jgi:hypothetical protein